MWEYDEQWGYWVHTDGDISRTKPAEVESNVDSKSDWDHTETYEEDY